MRRYELHRDIQSMFHSTREAKNVLYRIIERDRGYRLYIYSSDRADIKSAKSGMKYIGDAVMPDIIKKFGNRCGIDMLVVPTKKTNGKVRGINNRSERLNWIKRKASENGFTFCECEECGKETLKVNQHSGQMIFDIYAYEYRGEIEIYNIEKFKYCVEHGLGRFKAYGAGLVMLR